MFFSRFSVFCFVRKIPGFAFLATCTLSIAIALSGCSTLESLPAGHASSIRKLPSTNFNSRVRFVVIHHTSANFEQSVNILTKPSDNPVSSHYLVPDPSDDSYTQKTLKVYELVPENKRAWHAGRSYWGGKTGLNDQSIGIEVVNQTYCVDPDKDEFVRAGKPVPKRLCFYPDFPETQMQVLIDLLKGIQSRYPEIPPINYIGHSDIAPGRKIDPGPRFPWQRLYKLGFGAWFDDDTVVKYWKQFSKSPRPLRKFQQALNTYGYKIEPTGVLDAQTKNVVTSFQLHFRPNMVTGEPSLEDEAILFALIEKYKPKALDALLAPEPQ